MRRALLSFLAATLMSLEAHAADSGGQFSVEGIGGSTCENFVTAKSESSNAYYAFLGWLDGYMTGINQYAPETYDITPWQSQNRPAGKSRLTQVSCVGAHSRAPYKPLIKKGLWAHCCAPLQALIQIKWTFATPSKACVSVGAN